MKELIIGLIGSAVAFVVIMALVIGIGRTVGYFLGPKEDR